MKLQTSIINQVRLLKYRYIRTFIIPLFTILLKPTCRKLAQSYKLFNKKLRYKD